MYAFILVQNVHAASYFKISQSCLQLYLEKNDYAFTLRPLVSAWVQKWAKLLFLWKAEAKGRSSEGELFPLAQSEDTSCHWSCLIKKQWTNIFFICSQEVPLDFCEFRKWKAENDAVAEVLLQLYNFSKTFWGIIRGFYKECVKSVTLVKMAKLVCERDYWRTPSAHFIKHPLTPCETLAINQNLGRINYPHVSLSDP